MGLVRSSGLSGIWLGMTCTIACSNLWAMVIYSTKSWRAISDSILAKANVTSTALPAAAEEHGALLADDLNDEGDADAGDEVAGEPLSSKTA